MNPFLQFGLTPEQCLIERVNGLSYVDIAEKYHIPLGSCNYYFGNAKREKWYGATHALIPPVLDALKDGLTFSEIAKRFNISTKGVKNIAVDFNAERKFTTDEYYKLRKKGYTNSWIADYYGMGTSYLKKILASAPPDSFSSLINLTTGDIISRLYNAGVSIEILAASFGISASSIAGYLMERTDTETSEKELLNKHYDEFVKKKNL